MTVLPDMVSGDYGEAEALHFNIIPSVFCSIAITYTCIPAIHSIYYTLPSVAMEELYMLEHQEAPQRAEYEVRHAEAIQRADRHQHKHEQPTGHDSSKMALASTLTASSTFVASLPAGCSS
ncbi:hypothetical protein BDP27DRAFT_1422940 [Rhodocollybia butyracea]|uniref:Uncharacterized protein n=1 Tax=Rhodocollybia butyracea TaxID=206335 RepID=A0A9P5U5W4_9AGAR|nr:hypothetical protein BDP27DRAFT_1422940 [Rhodocollybia butyracea]